jgi:hypothetical protein
LADIKPFNTLRLSGESLRTAPNIAGGETTDPEEEIPADQADDFERAAAKRSAPGYYSAVYPSVTVRYPPLLSRAGGYEYAPPVVQSDAQDLDVAKNEAISEFSEHMKEVTDGEITVKGTPKMLPYDYFAAIPICNDIYTNTDMNPVTWELNEVYDIADSGDQYKTECGVSLAFYPSKLSVNATFEQI